MKWNQKLPKIQKWISLKTNRHTNSCFHFSLPSAAFITQKIYQFHSWDRQTDIHAFYTTKLFSAAYWQRVAWLLGHIFMRVAISDTTSKGVSHVRWVYKPLHYGVPLQCGGEISKTKEGETVDENYALFSQFFTKNKNQYNIYGEAWQ